MIFYKNVISAINRLLGINTVGVIKNSTFITVNRLVSIGLGFLSITIFTRLITPEFYGKYTFLVTVFELCAIFTLPGLTNALIQSVANGYEGNLRLVSMGRLKYGILGSLLLVCIAIYGFFTGNDTSISYGIFLSAIFFPLYYACSNYNAFYIGRNDFKTTMINNLILSISTTFFVIAILVMTKSLVVIFLGKLLISCIIMVALSYRALNSAGTKCDKSVIDYGKKLTFINIIGIMQGRAELLIVPFFFSFGDLAYFYIAQRVVGEYKGIWATLSAQMLPRLSAKTRNEAYHFVTSRYKYLLLLFGVITVVLAILIPIVFTYLFSLTYRPSIYYAEVLLLVSFIGLTGGYFENYMISQQLIKQISILRFVYPVAYLVSLPVLLWKFGIWGIIFARGIASLAYSVASIVLIRTPYNRQVVTA